MVMDVVQNPQKSSGYDQGTTMRKKHVSRDSKMCCCCYRFWCGAPATDERIHAPVLHDASQIDYCRYWGRTSLPPITSNHIVGLVHKNHIIRTCLMYHAACKVEFQPFKRSYSQLTFFNFFFYKNEYSTTSSTHPRWLFILERYKLCNIFIKSNNHDTGSTAYKMQNTKRWYFLPGTSKYQVLVIGGNEARPQYLQWSICDASWSTGACILSSVVGAPQQKRQQQQHILESRLTCFFS